MTDKKPKLKKLAGWARGNPGLAMLAACYAVAVAVALLVHLGSFVANRALYANGTLATTELSVADFELVNLEVREGGVLVSLTDDPQMWLLDTGMRVADLEVAATYSKAPLKQNANWADVGEDWSLRREAYRSGNLSDDSVSIFRLPATGGQTLRFDPGAVAGNHITIHRITANPKRPFYAFFIPSAGEAVALAVLPGLAASGLFILWQAGLRPRARRDARARKDVKADG